jgi:20S proteasome alpha/beta subunit
MEEKELQFKLHQIITSACDRDSKSGWGAIVYIVGKGGIQTHFYRTKQT